MNVIYSSIHRPVTTAGRRFASVYVKKPIPEIYQKSTFKDNFLNDPATYPLILIMATAATFLTGMSINALSRYKGLHIRPEHKHEVINDWDGDSRYASITEVLARNPKGFHRKALKDIRYEGLGVDHEEWVKSRRT